MSIFLQRLCMFLVLGSIITLPSCGPGGSQILSSLLSDLAQSQDWDEMAREKSEKLSKSWHEIMKWHAEEYFDDPKVIELCHAIEKENFVLVDKLIAKGANANAVGKDNMTPLLWAYPKNNIMIFKRLLEAGADPNIQVTSDFGVRSSERVSLFDACWITEGISVLEMSATTCFSGYFKAVMEHGGNPNLISKINYAPDETLPQNETPLHTVIGTYKTLPFKRKENAKLLIDAGADIEAKTSNEETPLAYAVKYSHESDDSLYDLVTLLVEAGADWETPMFVSRFNHVGDNFHTALLEIVQRENDVHLPIDEVIKREPGIGEVSDESKNELEEFRKKQMESYDKLIVLLKKKGADLDEAREDLKLWEKYNDVEGRKKLSEEEGKIQIEQIEQQMTQRLKERRERKEQKLAGKAEE